MAAKRILVWSKSDNQWVKTIDGTKHYLGKGRSKSNQEDYKKAEEAYFNKLEHLKDNPADDRTPREIKRDTQESSNNPESNYSAKQLKRCVNRYFRYQENRVYSGSNSITKGRFIAIKGYLKPFIEFYGEKKLITSIKPIDIENFSNQQLELVKDGSLKPNSVCHRFSTLKNFLKYCWENNLLSTLPRNMDRMLKNNMSRPDKIEIFAWTHKNYKCEISNIWNEASRISPEMELYVLLGLNCGFGVKDISDMRMNEVMWKKRGYTKIIRERSKTNQYSEHTLWTRTEELIKELSVGRYGTNDRCFLRKDGRLLCIYEKGWKNESIGTKFKNSIVRKLFGEDDSRSFRTLRKSGASFCASRIHGTDTLYLAHAPSTMSAKHYALTSYKKLDEVLSYMEQAFLVTPPLTKRWLMKPAKKSNNKVIS
jgi:integrase